MPDGHASTANSVATPYLDDDDVQLYHGDATTVLQGLPAGVAQTCVTSPPYWGLRDYGAEGQLGLEETPDLYVERMVAVFREVRRVLREDGTCWINLGDSFLPGKQLAGIPWRVAFALQTDGWYLRSDIIWSKPNPMPESVTDRPTKSHEYVFLLTKGPRYFYDADAIREPQTSADTAGGYKGGVSRPEYEPIRPGGPLTRERIKMNNREWNPAGRNRRSVWTIPTEPFPEAHFATYPQALVAPCIQAGTSEQGECGQCGAPWVRVTTAGSLEQHPSRGTDNLARQFQPDGRDYVVGPSSSLGLMRTRVESGWAPSCRCAPEDWEALPLKRQLVLDPFIGSGTTALVARNHGRRAIGIDLSTEYLAIAAKRTQQLSLLGGAA